MAEHETNGNGVKKDLEYQTEIGKLTHAQLQNDVNRIEDKFAALEKRSEEKDKDLENKFNDKIDSINDKIDGQYKDTSGKD